MPSTKRKSPEDDDEEQQHDDTGADEVEEDDPDAEAAVEAAIGDADMSMDDGGDLHQHEDNPDQGVGEEAQNQDVKRAAVGGDAQWNAMLFQLIFYKSVHGDLRPKGKEEGHKPLCDWMVAQRKEFKIYQESPDRSFLTPDQVKVLDHLQFPWNTRGDDHWIRNYDHLKQFYKDHGHCMVPRTFVDVPNLCHWVTDQRRQLKNLKLGKPSTMTKDRQRLLDELGFVWQVRNRTTWDMRFAELLEFKEQKGTTVVPQREYI
jgi:Helicase associated domain